MMRQILLVFSLFISFFSFADSASKLPKTEILGKEYYIYEVKKGESVYGIAKKYNWDLQELMRLNPQSTGKIQKGDRLYYPTGQISIVTKLPEPVEIDYKNLEPVKHKVKKGETVYSISRQYNVPLEILYKNNPSARKGVKSGEVIIIPQNGTTQYYYYTIKRGDTLTSISQKFNTSPEDILKNNPGLTVDNMKEGEIVRISINSNLNNIKTELVAEERVTQINSYKVSKNESWDDISEKTGVEVEVLKEANESEDQPGENNIINVPVIETVEVEKTTVYTESEEMNEEELQDLYESIKGIDSDSIRGKVVKIALILDDPNSNKDIDFTRGALIGISKFKDSPYKIDFKVLDGRVSSNNLIDNLEDFEPSLIISTADKAFPLFLADYGNTNNVQIVNVFDLKNDLYEDNASIVQLLPPSGVFNDRVSTKLYQENRNRKLIAVGEEDENDGMAQELFKLYDGEGEKISLEEFGLLEPDISQSLLIYSYASKKEDVSDFIKNVENLFETYPELDFRIIGRSNWIAMTDDFGDQFQLYSVYLPSRVWLNEESRDWKEFSDEYDEMFSGTPVRSIPNFAASGYDVMQYFIPFLASNKGDFNKGASLDSFSGIQNNIDLTRVNNWGGFINSSSYLLKFRNGSHPEKIVVK